MIPKKQTMQSQKISHTALLILIILFVAAVLIGCGENDEQDDLRMEDSDSANNDWGNYDDDGDEKPGFDDPEILAMIEDAPYDDPFDDLTKSKSSPEAIYLRVLWGNLTFDEDQTVAHDYSGSISVDDGLLVIERTVKFDFFDSEIETREIPNIVAWKSRILPHYDGLVLRLEPGATDDENNFLHVQIGPYSADFPVSELVDMILLQKAGYGDDQVAIASHRETIEGSGFVSGHWRDMPNASGGIFKSKWENDPGELLGHARCRYLPEEVLSGLVKGKYIDLNGTFQGFLEGEYFRTEQEFQAGTFDLDWKDQAGDILGKLEGIYLKRGSKGRGFALANWKAN